jgi:hypothetical protein
MQTFPEVDLVLRAKNSVDELQSLVRMMSVRQCEEFANSAETVSVNIGRLSPAPDFAIRAAKYEATLLVVVGPQKKVAGPPKSEICPTCGSTLTVST